MFISLYQNWTRLSIAAFRHAASKLFFQSSSDPSLVFLLFSIISTVHSCAALGSYVLLKFSHVSIVIWLSMNWSTC